MSSDPQVILVAGPMGAGKSTLATQLAARLGWDGLSEDDFWVANGWGGLRTPEQERVVQGQVVDRLSAIGRSGRSAVLEFILYAEPPNPLTAYEAALAAHDLATRVVVLKPSATEIMRRIERRGRPGDLERLSDRARDVEHQLRVLEAPAMLRYPTLDTTGQSPEEACRACLLALGLPVA